MRGQQPLYSRVPDATALLALEPEELAGVLIELLHEAIEDNPLRHTNRQNILDSEALTAGYPREQREAIQLACQEAWTWLEREGLLVPSAGPNANYGWVRWSRRGQRLRTASSLDAYRRANRLPRGLLHAGIGQTVWTMFMRGEYDTAVFHAFREVEVAVRQAGGFSAADVGVALMRKAFAPTTGPLSDTNDHVGEQQARMDLFAGAIGSYKNPSSHRHVNLDADETTELLVFASHLLRLVDEANGRTP